jgi:tetratricopeptide (TPR) repeat protein
MNMKMRLTPKLTSIVTLAAGCLLVSLSAGAGTVNREPVSDARSPTQKDCPPRSDFDSALANASALMAQSRFQDAATLLRPLSDVNCDSRVSLLVAAAMEGQGDVPEAIAVLQRAHTAWPSNNSIAASLAREYVNRGDVPKAVKALAAFHVAANTPEQEIRMAVVVYLAAHRLLTAQTLAEAAYKSYTSVSTLLLLANTLQLQGRYPDVIRLLEPKRGAYSGSPEFLVTMAESEFDASSYPAARQDLERALSLDPNMYQAHYLLGNVLYKLSDVDGAIIEYRRAINLAPDQPRTYFQLALALEAKQDDTGEQNALEEALATDNHYAPAQCEMGRILLEEHRPADAVGHLIAAIQSNPHSEKAYFLLARAYGQLGQKEKSDQMVKRLLAVKKENRPGQGGKNEDRVTASQSNSP